MPQVFDLLQDPQERYDIFMNNFTERTWTMVPISTAITKLMKTYVQYPPRKLQSMSYDGPIELSKYQKFQSVRDDLEERRHQHADASRQLIKQAKQGGFIRGRHFALFDPSEPSRLMPIVCAKCRAMCRTGA